MITVLLSGIISSVLIGAGIASLVSITRFIGSSGVTGATGSTGITGPFSFRSTTLELSCDPKGIGATGSGLKLLLLSTFPSEIALKSLLFSLFIISNPFIIP